MSIKSTILASAAAATVATFGVADTYFETGRTLESDDTLELGLITTDNAAILEIYDYHTGQQGRLLGQQNLHVGANTDVRVDTGLPTRKDVIAIVTIDGQVVATKQFDIE
ncbi:hypothetical protein [Yoonia sp. R2-816]|uniref:hypothetical protein n=1 Tax=Yoonia sp. R2-816 TaxID=3342638 RepID=UPI003727888F